MHPSYENKIKIEFVKCFNSESRGRSKARPGEEIPLHRRYTLIKSVRSAVEISR